MSMKVYLLLTLAATTAAESLFCDTTLQNSVGEDVCQGSNRCASPYQAQHTTFGVSCCTKEGHSCLTGKYAGGVVIAYGCYPDDVLEDEKTALIDACKADPELQKLNPDGPADGFTACKTDRCNNECCGTLQKKLPECGGAVNGAGALAPSLALLAVTMLTIASGL
jgi:hypothetical protein